MPSFADMSLRYELPVEPLTPDFGHAARTPDKNRGPVEPTGQVEPGLAQRMTGQTHQAEQSGMRRALQ